jgi:hypothetical protein
MNILNLDKVKPQSKVIELDGVTYSVPSTLVVDDYLEMIAIQQRLEGENIDIKAFGEMLTLVCRIFADNNKVKEKEIRKKINISSLSKIVVFLCSGLEEVEKKPEDGKPSEEKQ